MLDKYEVHLFGLKEVDAVVPNHILGLQEAMVGFTWYVLVQSLVSPIGYVTNML